METCVNCTYTGRPTYKSPCSECKGYSKHEAVEIRTNGDWIRAMSDEELADFITSQNRGICTDICRKMCYQYNLEWLKQPAEECNENA